MPVLLCPGCWLSLLALFLLWLVVWVFARVFKFKWAIKTTTWTSKKIKAIVAAARGKEEEKCSCEHCGK
jgi:hypothetical protein